MFKFIKRIIKTRKHKTLVLKLTSSKKGQKLLLKAIENEIKGVEDDDLPLKVKRRIIK